MLSLILVLLGLILKSYGFFDGVAITDYCIPKLLEISMVSGTFQVGETITGTMRPVGNVPATDSDPQITFRVAQANHKSGAFDSATEVFTVSPYNNSQTLPSAYSSTSTILNIDTFSLMRSTTRCLSLVMLRLK